MQKIELEIVALSHSITQSNSYAVILGEIGGTRRLPIVIGGFEAQAIAVALENMQPSRPLTHDLMKNFMSAFDIQLQEVYISDLQEGIFYSKLVCYTANDTIEIDSRTSDALALAVRFGCPIYVNASVLDKAGNEIETNENDTSTSSLSDAPLSNNASDLSSLSINELNELLNEVLEQEDYIRAIDIRDEIAKRNEQKKS
jgi:bifunctional DNase/RNase